MRIHFKDTVHKSALLTLWQGNSPVTQMGSNAEKASMWWRLHGIYFRRRGLLAFLPSTRQSYCLTLCGISNGFFDWITSYRQIWGNYMLTHKHLETPGYVFNTVVTYGDVIKWKHFPRNWPFVRGFHRSPVNYPHKGQWRGALMFSLICVWINSWVNNREAGNLRRYRAHYNVTVMWCLGAKTPGHQYPRCWPIVNCIRPVS